MLARSSERFSFDSSSTFLPKSSDSSIDLLLMLEQCYSDDYNNDDTAALAYFRGQGALLRSCYTLYLIKSSIE